MSEPASTVAALPNLLRAIRELVARDCPAGGDTAILRLSVLGALDWAEMLARVLAARMPAVGKAIEVVEIPRVPRFGPGDAAGPDRGLAGGRHHP